MKTCMRIFGMGIVPCGKPASVKVTRNRQVKFYCESCYDYLAARRKDKVRVERINEHR